MSNELDQGCREEELLLREAEKECAQAGMAYKEQWLAPYEEAAKQAEHLREQYNSLAANGRH